jgi:hypothetical protein
MSQPRSTAMSVPAKPKAADLARLVKQFRAMGINVAVSRPIAAALAVADWATIQTGDVIATVSPTASGARFVQFFNTKEYTDGIDPAPDH